MLEPKYDSGHIDNCIWIPLSDLNSNIDEIKSQTLMKYIQYV